MTEDRLENEDADNSDDEQGDPNPTATRRSPRVRRAYHTTVSQYKQHRLCTNTNTNASYYSNTPSHLNNFSCVDVTRMYNMIFSALKGNSFLFIGRRNQFRCALVCCNLLVKKNSPL